MNCCKGSIILMWSKHVRLGFLPRSVWNSRHGSGLLPALPPCGPPPSLGGAAIRCQWVSAFWDLAPPSSWDPPWGNPPGPGPTAEAAREHSDKYTVTERFNPAPLPGCEKQRLNSSLATLASGLFTIANSDCICFSAGFSGNLDRV